MSHTFIYHSILVANHTHVCNDIHISIEGGTAPAVNPGFTQSWLNVLCKKAAAGSKTLIFLKYENKVELRKTR